MWNIFTLTTLSLFCSVFAATAVIKPQIRLSNSYDDNYPEFIIETIYSLPDVCKYERELNLIRRHCMIGTWIVYDKVDYSGGHKFYSTASSVCDTIYWPPVSSVRRVGWSGDIYDSTFNIYSGRSYTDNETVFMSRRNINADFLSLIITGNKTITLYSRPNQTGLKLCIDAPENGISGGIKNVTETLGIFPGDIQSFDFGCDVTTSRERVFKLDPILPANGLWEH